MKKMMFKTALLASAMLASVASAYAFEEPVLNPSDLKASNPMPAVKRLQELAQKTKLANGLTAKPEAAASIQTPLKTFQYTVTSPRDGLTYTGSIVGSDPRNNGARTTNVEVVLIPLRIEFTGTVRKFDPTSPDVGCMGGNVTTALANTVASPLFNAVDNYTINGVNMGKATFIDAFQRAQFWQDANGAPVVAAKPAYHLGLTVTVAPKQTISLVNGGANGFTTSVSGDCSSNPVSGDNPPRIAELDINFVDAQLNQIITQMGLKPSQFPLFLTYRTVITENGGCCILGYHNSSTYDVTNPGQTYGISLYDGSHLFGGNIETLSHEILEWVNDPSANNLTPAWGNTGQVTGCQNNLETGDPLSGKKMPAVLMPNGISYTAQENAFFSWFYGTGFTGAGGKYSSNGTFTSPQAVCN